MSSAVVEELAADVPCVFSIRADTPGRPSVMSGRHLGYRSSSNRPAMVQSTTRCFMELATADGLHGH